MLRQRRLRDLRCQRRRQDTILRRTEHRTSPRGWETTLELRSERTTDFKVGRTVRLLEERGYEILVEIEWTSDPRPRENELIKRHRGRLLNDKPGYNYKAAKEDEELSRLREYVRENFASARSG